MQRNRHDHVPFLRAQRRRGLTDEQFGQKRFQPKRALIFVTADEVQHHAAGRHGRSCPTKMQFHFTAIAALEADRNVAFIGQPATVAKGRLNELNVLPAARTNIPFNRSGAVDLAELTGFRVEKTQAGIKPTFQVI